jgi:hypothetical protein
MKTKMPSSYSCVPNSCVHYLTGLRSSAQGSGGRGATPPPPDSSAATPARLNFLQRLEVLTICPAARDYYVRWAETWITRQMD